jgi:hypothetical protein
LQHALGSRIAGHEVRGLAGAENLVAGVFHQQGRHRHILVGFAQEHETDQTPGKDRGDGPGPPAAAHNAQNHLNVPSNIVDRNFRNRFGCGLNDQRLVGAVRGAALGGSPLVGNR